MMTKPKKPKPIKAAPYEIFRAAQINACLTCPAPVLPKEIGDCVRPFQIGINNDFKALLKPDGDVKALHQAITRYVRSKGYLSACAQPGAVRQNLEGQPYRDRPPGLS
jgi:ProP effector